jgi:hypothetical protein
MPPERTYSPLTQLITLVMRIGRKCPEVQGDILEIMLLVSQIQAHVGIDHGYRHARRVIARLRHPLWDDLTPEELAVLGEAANAIQRACKLTDGDIDEPGDGEPAMPARVALFGALHGRFGGELTEAQIARLADTVMSVLKGDA